MKDYLKIIKNNIWNSDYYEEVIIKPLKTSFKYYFKMTFWLVLFYTAFVSIFFLPEFILLTRNMVSHFSQSYPTELKVTFKDGQAFSNLTEPVVIPLAESEKKIFESIEGKIGSIENLLVIDTHNNFVLEEFDNYRSFFVLKKDALVARGADDKIEVSEIPAEMMVVSGADVRNMADKIQQIILLLAPLGVLIIYLFGISYFIFIICFLILIALFAWLLLYIAKRDLSFKQSLAITLHACTLPFLINFFIFILYPSLALNFPFLLTFTLLIIYLNLIRKAKTPVVIPVAPKDIPADTIVEEKEKKEDEKKEEVKE